METKGLRKQWKNYLPHNEKDLGGIFPAFYWSDHTCNVKTVRYYLLPRYLPVGLMPVSMLTK